MSVLKDEESGSNIAEIDKKINIIVKKIEELKKTIERHNYFYYVKNSSIISDKEYDLLNKELEDLQIEYKTLTGEELESKVGSSLKDTKFQKVKHNKPMMSLSNSYNIGDIVAFIERIKKEYDGGEYPKIELDLELKFDGLSISIVYEKGKLVRGITRGDGVVGEDVTENILQIESIPKYLNEDIDLEVRGEIIIPLSQFEEINNLRLEAGEEIFANPRNAAAGTLRQLDPQIVKERKLDAYFYFLVDGEKYGVETHRESLEFIKKLGIKTNENFEQFTIDLEKNIDDSTNKEIISLEKRISYWEKAKEELDYETDGLVIKVDNIRMWEEIGYTSKAPKWAIAYKFPAKQMTTKLQGITWQVGRTGKITPVAELKETILSGSRVKRASLHNYDEILRKDIRIGDTVFIEKAAEIIPQVVKSVQELRDGSEQIIIPPTNCPSCNTLLVKEEDLVDLKCPNPQCPQKIQGGIEYFVSRDGMNITGLGGKIIEKFIQCGYLKDISDVYLLKNYRDELVNMDKMGEKSIEKLLSSIEKSKSNDLSKIIYSLGIPFVGKVSAKTLVKNLKTFERIENVTQEELLEIDGVGEKGAKSIYNFFRDEGNKTIIKKLKEHGVNFSSSDNEPEFVGEKNNKIFGKTFLFTGKLTLFTRGDAQDKVEKLGGISAGSVNKKLDYLVVGDDAGSKLDKAQKIETIKILTEEQFLKLINEI